MPDVCTSFSSSLYYRKMGQGPVAVLLHGFPESSTLWRNIWNELAMSYTLILPDFPGTGESKLEGPVSIAQMAEGLKVILDAEQASKAVVIGHSMGGYVACAFAQQYPQYVQGISLVHSTPLADTEEKKDSRKKVIEIVKAGGKDHFLRQMVTSLFAEQFVKDSPAVVEEQITNAQKMSSEAVVNSFMAMMERADTTQALATAPYPIQWVMGAQDGLIPVKKLLSLCHTSDVNYTAYYADCGHMAMVETPAQLQADLKDFLDNCYNA